MENNEIATHTLKPRAAVAALDALCILGEVGDGDLAACKNQQHVMDSRLVDDLQTQTVRVKAGIVKSLAAGRTRGL